MTLDPFHGGAYNNRGLIQVRIGDYLRAVADFSKAIEVRTGFACSYDHRGLVYEKLGDSARAIADYTAALAIAPHNADALYHRGSAYAATGESEKAVADFQLLVQVNDARHPLAILAKQQLQAKSTGDKA